MKSKKKQVIGVITTVAIVGFAVYTIKKYYDAKKQDEQAIDLEEAKRMVEDHSHNKHSISEDAMEELVDEAREHADYNSSFHRSTNIEHERRIAVRPEEIQQTYEDVEEEEDEDYFEGPDPEEIQDSKGYYEKEVSDELRYEPNSADAREQFINMELVSLGRESDTRDIVSMLYDHMFVPTCDEDQNLKTRLIDHRIKFFGHRSVWNSHVSYGDLIMYYAKAAEYNCGQEVRYWVDYFLSCTEMNDIMLTSEDICERIKSLNSHRYYNDELKCYGLFGLNDDQLEEAAMVARKRIDECITYDIEFHQFVQGVI